MKVDNSIEYLAQPAQASLVAQPPGADGSASDCRTVCQFAFCV